MNEPVPLQQTGRTYVLYKGGKLSYFAGCDYFRMASHPAVIRALERTARTAGLNVAASRLTTGNHVLYRELEGELERFFDCPRATVVQAGYLTNLIAAQAMAGEFSHALIDSAAHSALRDAAMFLKCPVADFETRNPQGLARAIKECGAKCRPVVLTDGMFARDGSVAPLKGYLEVLPAGGVLLVDDAHGAGVVGARGRGSVEHCGISRQRVVQTVTLSKAFGVYGGGILASAAFHEKILARSTLFVASTPLPLPLAGASLKSLQFVAAHPEIRTRIRRNAARIRDRLRAAGFDIPDTPGPVFCLEPRSPALAKKVSDALMRSGIFPSLIRYPGISKGGIFRFVISSEHTSQQLDQLAGTLEQFSPKDLAKPL